MPKFKLFFFFVALVAIIYFYNNPQVLRALAQSSLIQEVQDKIDQSLEQYSNKQNESQTNEDFIAYLGTLSSQELVDTQNTYTETQVSKEQDTQSLLNNESIKSLSLTLSRYEKLNSYLYRLIDQISTSSKIFTDSGFDSSNMQVELKNVITTLSSIEAHNQGIKMIIDKLKTNELSPKEGLTNALQIINKNKESYYEVFSKVSKLRSENLEQSNNAE